MQIIKREYLSKIEAFCLQCLSETGNRVKPLKARHSKQCVESLVEPNTMFIAFIRKVSAELLIAGWP